MAEWYDLCVSRHGVGLVKIAKVEVAFIRNDGGKRFGLVRAVLRARESA